MSDFESGSVVLILFVVLLFVIELQASIVVAVDEIQCLILVHFWFENLFVPAIVWQYYMF